MGNCMKGSASEEEVSVFKGIELFSYGRCLCVVWRVWLLMGQSLKISTVVYVTLFSLFLFYSLTREKVKRIKVRT